MTNQRTDERTTLSLDLLLRLKKLKNILGRFLQKNSDKVWLTLAQGLKRKNFWKNKKINLIWSISCVRLPSSPSPTSVRSGNETENTQDKCNSSLQELSCTKLKYINNVEENSSNWEEFYLTFITLQLLSNQFSDECDY